MVNGALEYIAKDLGIAEDTVVQGVFIFFHYLVVILFDSSFTSFKCNLLE